LVIVFAAAAIAIRIAAIARRPAVPIPKMITAFFGLDYQFQPDEQKEQGQKNKTEIEIDGYDARAFQQSRQAEGNENKAEDYVYHNFCLPAAVLKKTADAF
jgi:hypothetical protein